MINLQQDLLLSQTKIVALLTSYEKVSEDIIKSNYTTQLHSLLDSIASFDHIKIKQCENNFKDEAAIRYIQHISQKIKNNQQPKNNSSNENTAKTVEKTKPQEVKRQSRIAEKREQSTKKGGIFQYVRSKFSKEKKSTEMIFPEEQPKCYYDPVTKTYVFEGQQPQAPKAIPKPPSVASKKGKQEPKKATNDDSELGQLTAPPAFKRKSTPGTSAKGKVKIKQQIQVMKEEEPLSFAKVMQTINQTYSSLLQKAKNGAYERHVQLSSESPENITELMSFAERTLQTSQEISVHENKLIEKWGKILASESRELKVMQKVIKEIEESAQTYSAILSKLDSSAIKQQSQKIIKEEVFVIKEVIREVEKQIIKEVEKEVIKEVMNQKKSITVDQKIQTSFKQIIEQQIKVEDNENEQSELQKQMEDANRKINDLKIKVNTIAEQNQKLEFNLMKNQTEISQLKQAIHKNQGIIAELTLKNIHISQDLQSHQLSLSQLSQKNKWLSDELKSYQQRQKRINDQHSQKISQLTQQYKSQIKDNINKIADFQSANYQLQRQKQQLSQELKQQRLKINASIDKVSSELSKQKSKIESQLKFYEEKEKMYINSIKHLQDQQSLIQEYESALCQDSQLLNAILEKRLQLSKNPQNEDFNVYSKHTEEPSSNSIILQLSDIVNSITETHLDRLEAYSRYYSRLNRKYLQTKQALNKIKTNVANENLSLNRNVTRLKGLLQNYKTSKDEAEERCTQLELECDKLKKKLQHYKEEDQFNKSYLSRLKTSKIHSQNESVLSLQEDNEELVSEIDELQRELGQKEQLIKKNQNDLEYLLINYEKNQSRLLQTQKKYKQSEKELRINKQQLEQSVNSNKLLELKLQNIKDKCDQIQNREQSKLRNAESGFDKKLKLIKHDLDQTTKREEQLKIQVNQIRKDFKAKLSTVQQSQASIINDLNKKIMEKQSENGQLLFLMDQLNQKLQQEQQEKVILLEKNRQLYENDQLLNFKIGDLVDEYLNQNAISMSNQHSSDNNCGKLMQRIIAFQAEQESFRRSYQLKINELQEALDASFDDSKQLMDQIEQYSQLLNASSKRFEQINHNQHKKSYQNEIALENALNANKQLLELIQTLRAQNQRFQQMSEHQKKIIHKNQIGLKKALKESEELNEEIDMLKISRQQIERSILDQRKNSHNNQVALQQALNEINDLQDLIESLKEQIDKKAKQNAQFEDMIENISQDMARLTSNTEELSKGKTDLEQRLMFKERQIETLNNQINKKSEELMIRTEELLEKDSFMLEQQELSVMKKEEFDELKNQMLQLAAEVKNKDVQIQQLTADLEELAQELAQTGDDEDHVKAIQVLNSHIAQLKQSIELKDQQITNFAENFYKLNYDLEQKDSQIQRLNELIKSNVSDKEEIQELNSAILVINSSLEESQTRIAELQKLNLAQQVAIRELQQKLSQKDAQLSLILEKLSNAEKEITKEIDQTDEVQGEMEYLLKEIEQKDTQIEKLFQQFRLKQFQYSEIQKKLNQSQIQLERVNQQLSQKQKANLLLTANVEDSDKEINRLLSELQNLTSKFEHITEKNLQMMEEKLNHQKQMLEKESQKQQLLELIETLQKEIQSTHKQEKIQEQTTQIQLKQQTKVIEDLIEDIRIKDETIIEKQKEIESKQQELRIVKSEKEYIQQVIRETKILLAEKGKLVTQGQISEQEKIRVIVSLEKNLKESDQKCSELEGNLAELAQIIEGQENMIQSLKNQAAGNDNRQTIERINTQIAEKAAQIAEAKRKSQQIRANFASKQTQYEKKIENLEKEIAGINSLKNSNKKLEQSVKALQDENRLLVNEKVELMKSNNYLVDINQKLIADKSPHNTKQAHKVQPKNNSSSNEKSGQKMVEPKESQTNQTKQGKKENKGIFGALSSLFLTPTETDRLKK